MRPGNRVWTYGLMASHRMSAGKEQKELDGVTSWTIGTSGHYVISTQSGNITTVLDLVVIEV